MQRRQPVSDGRLRSDRPHGPHAARTRPPAPSRRDGRGTRMGGATGYVQASLTPSLVHASSSPCRARASACSRVVQGRIVLVP